MQDGTWSDATWKRLKEQKLSAPIPEEWKKFETDFMVVYKKAQADARELLKKGDRNAAIKLMNDTATAIWKDAAALMKLQ